MHEVYGGCKLCGRQLLTDGSPLIHQTCDACKAERRRQDNRKLAARRKAERHAARTAKGVPRCEQCSKILAEPVRLDRKFCGDICRQAAFRARNPRGTTRHEPERTKPRREALLVHGVQRELQSSGISRVISAQKDDE